VFTGLVQHVGVVASTAQLGATVRLVVDSADWAHRPARGDSICISGCCLTLAEPMLDGSSLMAFDVVPETLAKTKLGRLVPGDRVNLEHSVTASTLMGGHVVQGHVDGVAPVIAVQSSDDWRISFRPPTDLLPYFVPKGSVCIDGVSLTLAHVDVAAGQIGVALIPETLAKTTLGRLKPGDTVNVEADVLVKTIVHTLRHFATPSANLFADHSHATAGNK
jgi:riboflavin synthase